MGLLRGERSWPTFTDFNSLFKNLEFYITFEMSNLPFFKLQRRGLEYFFLASFILTKILTGFEHELSYKLDNIVARAQ